MNIVAQDQTAMGTSRLTHDRRRTVATTLNGCGMGFLVSGVVCFAKSPAQRPVPAALMVLGCVAGLAAMATHPDREHRRPVLVVVMVVAIAVFLIDALQVFG